MGERLSNKGKLTSERLDSVKNLRGSFVLGPRRHQSWIIDHRPLFMLAFTGAGVSPILYSGTRNVALLVPGKFTLQHSAPHQLSSHLCLPPSWATDIHLYRTGFWHITSICHLWSVYLQHRFLFWLQWYLYVCSSIMDITNLILPKLTSDLPHLSKGHLYPSCCLSHKPRSHSSHT